MTLRVRFTRLATVPKHRVLLLAAFAAASASGTARGQLAGTQPGGLAAGMRMVSADQCKSCHSGPLTPSGASYMPWDTWAGSMMANAARDPFFLATLTIAEQDRPGSGTYCIRCHTPSAFVESRATRGDASLLTEVDREGVQCAVCHRSIDASRVPISDPGAPYVGNAQLFFEIGTPTEVGYHGPYDDSLTPAHGAFRDPFGDAPSRLCGQCHQVESPYENLYDAAGRDMGRPFPLDTTYEEWRQSAYATGPEARSCVSCHMPREPGMLPVATGATDRPDPSRHDLVGGNEWGPAMLKAAFPGLRDEAYDRSRAAAQASLRAAAGLEIRSLPLQAALGSEIELGVRVTNLSGHKLPTGYADGRRVWLEIAVIDQLGKVSVQSGAYDVARAHLDDDPQLRLYEAVHGREGRSQDHIVLHRQILKDTRIPPRGFVATPATMPIGPISFSDGQGGFVPHDDASFRIEIPMSAGQATVRARLYYQVVGAHHIEAIAAANTTDSRGAELKRLWEQTERASPFLMVEATRSIEIYAGDTRDAGMDADPTPDADADAPRRSEAGPPSVSSDSEGGCQMARLSRSTTGATAWWVAALLGAIRHRGRRRPAVPRAAQGASRRAPS
jgi:hypothetical protein